MFNARKPPTAHGFVKAYSNNWLSQLSAAYKYESPKDVPRKPNNQHRKIALYSVLAMAFVAFFTFFMIVHETQRRTRQLVIESSFSNETAIEPSAGGYNTILTTPLSSGVTMANESLRVSHATETEGHDVSTQSKETAMKRTRRLRYYGDAMEMSSPRNPVAVGRDRLVFLPARFLKPPPPPPAARDASSRRREWSSGEQYRIKAGTLSAPEQAERRRDSTAMDSSNPKPFHVAPNGPLPVGFQPTPSPSATDWSPYSIEDIIRQLTLAKRKQQQQFYYNYPWRPSLQPSEFNHPVHQNHRVKFTGIYRHPRKNGDITTLFGAASQRPQEVHVQAPQLINQQLGMGANLMPDRLYNFKPHSPSEVNLLATEQFRFAPQKNSQEDTGGAWSNGWPRHGMPFSVMLNLEPMAAGGRLRGQQQQQQQQRYPKRYRYPYQNPYRQQWATGESHVEQHFAQLSPYHHRTRPQNNLYRDAFGQGENDEYEGDNYFRKDGRVQPRMPAYASPLIGPGRLMVHFNIFPKQQPSAVRRDSGLQTDESRLGTTPASLESVELNKGEQLAKNTAEVRLGSRPIISPLGQFFHPPVEPQRGTAEGGRSLGKLHPSPTTATSWAFPADSTLSTTVVQPTYSPLSTVEVIKSVEVPTNINFDHVPLGRNPPSPLPSFSRWTSDEEAVRLWGMKNNTDGRTA